jgi:hypothetical protein
MGNEQDEYHSAIRRLKKRWDYEDAERHSVERRTQEIFLEGHANQVFAPIEDYLTRLDEVLRAVGASVEIDPIWTHLGEQKLCRTVRVKSAQPAQQLSLALTIRGVSIWYHDRPYQFSQDTEALMRVITREVEQFLKPR